MNKMKKFLLQALFIKIGVVFLGIAIICTRYIVGKVWFTPQAGSRKVKKAIEQATDDVDIRNEFGQTGLMYAAGNAQLETAQFLIKKGANLDLVSDDGDGNTALHIACFNGDFPQSYKIAELLIEKGANVNAKNSRGQHSIHYILEIDNLVERLSLMKKLKKAGANINVQNNEGNTMLHLAVGMRDKAWIQIVRKEFGAALRTNIKNKNNETPIEFANRLGFTGEDSVVSALTKR